MSDALKRKDVPTADGDVQTNARRTVQDAGTGHGKTIIATFPKPVVCPSWLSVLIPRHVPWWYDALAPRHSTDT